MDSYNISKDTALTDYVSAVMRRVYLKMTAALIVTAAMALFCSQCIPFLTFMFNNNWAFFGLMLVEVGLVISISGRINKIKSSTASLLFYLYSIVTGASMSVIFLAYTTSSIGFTFVITAVVFAVMSIYGYITHNDLSRMGSFLVMGLIGLIVVSVINIFLKSSAMEWIISFVGVAIFIGLTAWDTQKIKRMAMETDESNVGKLATIGALSLYLDFINIFLYLLRFFGNSRD